MGGLEQARKVEKGWVLYVKNDTILDSNNKSTASGIM